MDIERYQNAVALIDEAHEGDPNRVPYEQRMVGGEWLYARRMMTWLEVLDPEASHVLKLAVRCQHLRRWTLARNQYPKNRVGYLRWRSALAKLQAEYACELLTKAGYDKAEIERIQQLIQKKDLRRDRETQTLEDVACLTFLQFEFAAFSAKHEDEKLIDIVQKTWKKMSQAAHEHALRLSFGEKEGQIIAAALQQHPRPD